MKEILFMLLLSASFIGCKSTSAVSTKVDNRVQSSLKGNWTIQSVTYPNSNVFKVNSFQLADSQCFVGSAWKLVANNDSGTMSIEKGGCPSFSSPIKWYINKDGQFVLKVLNAGEKAKRVKDGYVLSVANVTESSFQLVDVVDIAGKQTNIVYQFVKN